MKRETYRRVVFVVFVIAVIIQASIYVLLMFGINPFKRHVGPAAGTQVHTPATHSSATRGLMPIA